MSDAAKLSTPTVLLAWKRVRNAVVGFRARFEGGPKHKELAAEK
jgi:hypothetical protein